MKTSKILSFICGFILLPIFVNAEEKEVKAYSIKKVEKAKGSGEFQIKLSFPMPAVPQGADIDEVTLVLDQQFENLGRWDSNNIFLIDSTDMPRGMANKTQLPLSISVFPEDQFKANDWSDVPTGTIKKHADGMIPPILELQKERKAGRWGNAAVQVPIGEFVRDRLKSQLGDLSIVVTASLGNTENLKTTKVDIDISKLTGRLIILYTEPPKAPPWYKKK